jgi:NADH dehydrogenase
MILVVGATGVVGGDVCRQLAARGEKLRAVVRPTSSPARVAGLRELGAELVEGDLCDPGSLVRACTGANAIVSTASALGSRRERDTIDAVDHWGQLDLVDAAEATGVERFVYVSLPEPAFAEPSPLSEAKRAVEYRLRASSIEWTVLRPAALMEFWFAPERGFDLERGRARVYGACDGAVSWICAADVARFAVCALDDPRAHATELALGGAQALSQIEVVREFEQQTGRAFALEHVTTEELRLRMAASGDPAERSLLALMSALGHGAGVDVGPLLRAYPGTLLPVQGYALRVWSAARRN